MVVSIREVANKYFLFLSTITLNSTITQILSNTDIDMDIDMIRERSALTSRVSSKSLSTSLSTLSISYHQHMELNNNLSDTVSWKLIDSFQLSYAGEVKVGNLVRLATDKNSASNSQCVCNEILILKKKS